MDIIQSIQNYLNYLDHRGTININIIKKWLFLVVVAFSIFFYSWNWLFKRTSGIEHYPYELLPPELKTHVKSKLIYQSESEARSLFLREVEFAIIACGCDRDKKEVARSAFRLMKSAAISTKLIIHFHIFTDDCLYEDLIAKADRWPLFARHRVSFQFHHASYPEALLSWKNLYKPCSLFKLFLPSILKSLNHVVYVDIDYVFLSPLENLWSTLKNYDADQMISVSHSIDYPYQKIKNTQCLLNYTGTELESVTFKIPFFQPNRLSVNVLLFDVHKMKEALFVTPISKKNNCTSCLTMQEHYVTVNMTWSPQMLLSIYNLFKNSITVPDQDVLNIIFAFNPDKMYLLSYGWNFSHNFCSSHNMAYNKLSQCTLSHLVHLHKGQNDLSKLEPEISGIKEIFDKVEFSHGSDTILKNITNLLYDLKTSEQGKWINGLDCAIENALVFLHTFQYNNQ